MTLRSHISKIPITNSLRNLPAVSRIPPLATNKVASVPPGHRVPAALAHGVLGRATSISPPRVEVSVVVSLGAGSRLTLLKKSSRVAIFALTKEVEGSSEDAGSSHSGKKQRLEGNHLVLSVADLCWMQ